MSTAEIGVPTLSAGSKRVRVGELASVVHRGLPDRIPMLSPALFIRTIPGCAATARQEFYNGEETAGAKGWKIVVEAALMAQDSIAVPDSDVRESVMVRCGVKGCTMVIDPLENIALSDEDQARCQG